MSLKNIIVNTFNTVFQHKEDDMTKALDKVMSSLEVYTKTTNDGMVKIEDAIRSSDVSKFSTEFIDALTTITNYLVYGKNDQGIITVTSDNLRFSIGLPNKIDGLTVDEVIESTKEEFKQLSDMIFNHDSIENSPFIEKLVVEGKPLHLRVRKNKFYNRDGSYLGVCVVIDDVTDRMESIEKIKKITKSNRILKELDLLETKILEV